MKNKKLKTVLCGLALVAALLPLKVSANTIETRGKGSTTISSNARTFTTYTYTTSGTPATQVTANYYDPMTGRTIAQFFNIGATPNFAKGYSMLQSKSCPSGSPGWTRVDSKHYINGSLFGSTYDTKNVIITK